MKLEKCLRLIFTLGFVISAATIIFEWHLRATSPIEPIQESGQVEALKVKGGVIYVRSADYLIDRIGLFGGAGLCIGSLLAYSLILRKDKKDQWGRSH